MYFVYKQDKYLVHREKEILSMPYNNWFNITIHHSCCCCCCCVCRCCYHCESIFALCIKSKKSYSRNSYSLALILSYAKQFYSFISTEENACMCIVVLASQKKSTFCARQSANQFNLLETAVCVVFSLIYFVVFMNIGA